MIFILNSKNYESLKKTNFFPYLYLSYENSMKESKINYENFEYLKLNEISESFKTILNRYNINEKFLLKQDKIVMKNILSKNIVKGKKRKIIYKSSMQKRRGHCQIRRKNTFEISNKELNTINIEEK